MFSVLPFQISLGFSLIPILVLVLAIITVYRSVEIVNAYERRVLTVFGEYRKLLEPGINFVPPFVSRTYPFDLRTQTLDIPHQEAITRDNSPVRADAIVYIRVMDAKRAFLEVEDYHLAVLNLAQTTLRAVLGDMELDETLSKRSEINARIRHQLDEPTDEWGIRVESVEVREVSPSEDVQKAMEQQTGAERRRRATILEAQGQRRSAIEQAEGNKKAAVINAQGQKQSRILEAQGDAISIVLRARAAESMGERAIIEKGMETLQSIGESDATTFVLPQELTSLFGRYAKHLTGSDLQRSNGHDLDSQGFDSETRELLGLDNIAGILGEIDQEAEVDIEALEKEAEAIKTGGKVDPEVDNATEAGNESETEAVDKSGKFTADTGSSPEHGVDSDTTREERTEPTDESSSSHAEQ